MPSRSPTMADNTVYLITGANRGLGKQMLSDLLLRTQTTVIATVRNAAHPTAETLPTLPTASTSRLVVFELNNESDGLGYKHMQNRLRDLGFSHLDCVIANAGTSPDFTNVLEAQADVAKECFEVNSVGPMRLFQECWPLLQTSDEDKAGSKRKFLLITSSTASIKGLEDENFPTVAYGMSKAAANWLAKKISVEFGEKGLRVGIIHPGWVQTDMGQGLADALGLEAPPMSMEESSRQVLRQIDKLDSGDAHGQFVSYDGQPLPW